ncbi:MAG TPA: cadmium-containing carbonic anhydrase [Candidatus Saccharibacteria bacterium]|jgi:hypothetical protein|nr:cadmium-containing carbonic anhydrase [Candidatus Saccharibacteria bacterium]
MEKEEAEPSLPEVVRSAPSRLLRVLGKLALRLSDILDNKKGGEVVGDIVVDEIAPNGLGFGGGSISGESGKNGIDEKILDDAAQEILKQDYYKTVEVYDSGCGDGRPVKSIWAKIKTKFDGEEHQLEASQSKLRPKLFGGDLATLYSILAVSSYSGSNANNFKEMDRHVVSIMNNMGWVMGIHNDDHGDDLHGCGAIDRRPEIIATALKYEDDIAKAAESLLGVGRGDINLTNIIFQERKNGHYFDGYDGAAQQQYLEQECENVARKELTGNHQEAFVVINTRKGVTFDQESFRQSMVDEHGVDSKIPQVFVVDIWQAESMIDALAKKGHIDESRRSSAMAAVTIYTLATAATLTDGTLPVFLAK